MRDAVAIIRDEAAWLVCEAPLRTIRAAEPGDVRRALEDVERLTRSTNCRAVGFVTYEAGEAFGLPIRGREVGLPLVWFGLFDSSRIRRMEHLPESGPYELGALEPSVDRATFEEAFRRIKGHLADGDSYQVDYTFRLHASFEGDVRSLFRDLAAAQRAACPTFVDIGSHALCSASPELFFQRVGDTLVAQPMKGTARRGLTVDQDEAARERLRESPKQRAENVMIVDMVRNDLGRVSDVGSVRVDELFSVERYPNVWQMTSRVVAQSSAPLADIFAAMHPSASVTGAPKRRTMQILSELEMTPRGVYTGAIGQVGSDGSARFNVAIRTAVVDRVRGSVEFGIGSGIVWDSVASDEYEECLLKGAVLGQRPHRFDLLETLRWMPGDGFFLLERHLERLVGAADYFGFPLRLPAVQEALAAAVRAATDPRRVRLLVAQDGEARAESAPLALSEEPMQVRLADRPVDPSIVYLYHKTTNRSVYDRARRSDCDDVILWNPAGEVTESTVANVVMDRDGALVTPPVESGLLAGTLRAELLASGRILEATITVDEACRARCLWLINSVHGWRRALLEC